MKSVEVSSSMAYGSYHSLAVEGKLSRDLGCLMNLPSIKIELMNINFYRE